MNESALDLQQMVAQLAAMTPADRDRVLDLVGDDTSRKLLPLLNERASSACSPAMTSLIGEVSGSAVPEGLTTRAAAAIRDTAQRLGARAATTATAPSSVRQDGTIGRLLRPLTGGGRL